jgi:hypothetical protein
MNFLKYIERSAENLQFFLWHRDYCKRFSGLPDGEKALSPEWNGENVHSDGKTSPKSLNAEAEAILQGTSFSNGGKLTESEKRGSDPFFTPPRTPNSVERTDYSLDSYDESMAGGRGDHTQRAAGAFDNAGLKWQPREYNLC